MRNFESAPEGAFDNALPLVGTAVRWRPPNLTRERYDELTVEVEVLGTRVMFGRTDYQIRPVRGSGTRWVNEITLRR